MDDINNNFDLKYLDQIFSNDLEEKCSLSTNNDVYDLVYSIGDIHGDYQAFHNIITHLINSENKLIILFDEITKKYFWNKEVSNICIIQTGDIIDGIRNENITSEYYEKYKNDDLMIIDIMLTLKEEAENNKNNNKIILLYGNHEIENIFNIISIKDLNYNNYLKSDKSKLSEIDYCIFNINPEHWKTRNILPTEDEFKNYQICKSKIGNFSIKYKDVNRYDTSEENINNYFYNKNLIEHRFNYINKLKNRILCNYQTYAIVNNYLFCHSGFISKFVENLFNIYNQYKSSLINEKDKEHSKDSKIKSLQDKTTGIKQLSIEEFINESIKNKNQDFINTFNKIFTKIINYLWKIYDDETLKIDPSFKLFINQYKQNIHNIIWSDNFRNFYLNIGDFNNIDNFKYVNNSINFILYHLHLNGIIMGHIAENNIRKIKINNDLHDFYIYLTDIAISRAFHSMNLINGKYYYNYHKFYNILQIDKNGNISYLKINNNFKDNIKETETKEVEINYSDLINKHITKYEIFDLIKEFIKNNNKIISNDTINSFYLNHDKIPDSILIYLKNYLHINITSDIKDELLKHLISIIDEILLNKLKEYFKNIILSEKLNIFDLNWIYYATSNKEILDLQLNDSYENIEVVQNCFQGLLKIYYNCDTIDKNILKLYYNKQIDFINYTIKTLILQVINSKIQTKIKTFILKNYNLLLKTILLQKGEDFVIFKEIICILYDIQNENYYTINFNMNLNEKNKKIIEERKKYLTSFISLFKKNINVIMYKYKVSLSNVINKMIMTFIIESFKQIIEYVNLKKINRIKIKIDNNFILSVENIEKLTFDINNYLKTVYKIDNELLQKKEITMEITNSINLILTHNYKLKKLVKDENLILYGEIIF